MLRLSTRRLTRAFFLIILLCTLLSSATATTLIDENGSEMTNIIVTLLEGEEAINVLVTPQQPLFLQNESRLFIKNEAGDGYAYLAQRPAGGWLQAVILEPVGLLRGTVRDHRENYVDEARLFVYCATAERTLTTDTTGHFQLFLPPGECLISATRRDASGAATASITQGETATIELRLGEPPLITPKRGISWLLILLCILGLLLWFILRRSRPKEEGSPVQEERDFFCEQVRESLTEKECVIVDQLLLREGEMTLAELRHATRMPRTSLVRTLQGLEGRNILLRKERHGKKMILLVKRKE